MIDQQQIEAIILPKLEGSDIFIVDIQVKPGNMIQVYLDTPDGIALERCVEISRLVESSFDREKEDFELQVSSPGLDQGFKVIQQYQKNLGKVVKVLLSNGEKFKGVLTEADSDGFHLEAQVKVKKPGSKKKSNEIKLMRLEYKDIKSTKVNLEF